MAALYRASVLIPLAIVVSEMIHHASGANMMPVAMQSMPDDQGQTGNEEAEGLSEGQNIFNLEDLGSSGDFFHISHTEAPSIGNQLQVEASTPPAPSMMLDNASNTAEETPNELVQDAIGTVSHTGTIISYLLTCLLSNFS